MDGYKEGRKKGRRGKEGGRKMKQDQYSLYV